MVAVYFSRKLATINALRKGLVAFETFQPMPTVDKNCWTYEERPDGPGIKYAKLWSEGKDWVHHCEITKELIPVLIVTCFREEILEAIPELFRLSPMTPSLWEANRREYPAPMIPFTISNLPFKTPTLPVNPVIPAAPVLSSVPILPIAPVATVAAPMSGGMIAVPAPSKRSLQMRAICEAVYNDMPHATGDVMLLECVKRGVSAETAKAKLAEIMREYKPI